MYQREFGKCVGEKIWMELDQVEQSAKLCESKFTDMGALSYGLGPSIFVRTPGTSPISFWNDSLKLEHDDRLQ